MTADQTDLFDVETQWPEGLRYQPELISAEEAQRLVAAIEPLPFKPLEFHGYLGKRRVVSFGWRYDYGRREIGPAEPIPDFLKSLRDRAAGFAGLPAEEFRQVLVTDYEPGACIGWRRDKPVFGEMVGISLLSACVLRFRRRTPQGWERRSLTPQPRSAYLLKGPARTIWEHSIPGVAAKRYSVTFRRQIGD